MRVSRPIWLRALRVPLVLWWHYRLSRNLSVSWRLARFTVRLR